VTLSAATADGLAAAGIPAGAAERIVRAALEEDLAYGPDRTTAATVDPAAVGIGDVTSRAVGVIAGVPLVSTVLEVGGLPTDGITVLRRDGSAVGPGDVILTLRAPLAGLLGVERTLLNLLTHLSGVATHTRQWVEALAGTGCRVRDTRKTTPGLRALEKYAVRCGGGVNHRMGLGDAALVKDNHVVAVGGVAAAVAAVRSAAPDLPLEVECDTLAQVDEAIGAGAELLLLDNMDPDQLRAAVAVARAHGGVRLEASGGLRLETAREVAATGVDYVAVGGLTHSSPVLDLGLDLRGGS